jgi:D-amino peptidase
VLEVFVRTADIAEAASWVRGVDRTGPRQLRIHGADRLDTYQSFCAAILLTRAVAEAV